MNSLTKKITSSALCAALAMGSFGVVPQTVLAEETSNVITDSEETETPPVVVITLNQAEFKPEFTCSSKAIRINWNKVDNAAGYIIYRYDSTAKEWKKLVKFYDNDITTFRDEYKIVPGNVYRYKIAAFAEVDGVEYTGEESPVLSTAARPEKTVMSTSYSAKNAVRITWKKQNCSGYKVYQYKNNKWTLVSTLKSSSTYYRATKLKSGTIYKFKVVPYTKYAEGKTVSGASGNVTSISTTADIALLAKVEMPANVSGKKNSYINVKATKNSDNYRVVSAKVTTPNVSYKYKYDRNSVSFKFNKAGKYRVSVTFKNAKGNTVTCFTNITVK